MRLLLAGSGVVIAVAMVCVRRLAALCRFPVSCSCCAVRKRGCVVAVVQLVAEDGACPVAANRQRCSRVSDLAYFSMGMVLPRCVGVRRCRRRAGKCGLTRSVGNTPEADSKYA